MRVLGAFCAVAMLSVPLAASASGGNNLDLYYLSSGIELEVPGLGSGEDDGDGFGAKGRFAISDALFLSAEYQTAKLDDLDEDLTQIRLGVGGSIPISPELWVSARAEYVDSEIENFFFDGSALEDDGPAFHAGLVFASGGFSLFGEVGYLKLGDSDGPEFSVGAAFAMSEAIGLFLDYRLTSLEIDDSDGSEFDIDDFRAGIRLSF